jgi:hypothetical protein
VRDILVIAAVIAVLLIAVDKWERSKAAFEIQRAYHNGIERGYQEALDERAEIAAR